MVDPNEPSISNAEIQELKERVHELEGMVGYLTDRNLFLSETLAKVVKPRPLTRPTSSSEEPASAESVAKVAKARLLTPLISSPDKPSSVEGVAKVTSRLIGKSEPHRS